MVTEPRLLKGIPDNVPSPTAVLLRRFSQSENRIEAFSMSLPLSPPPLEPDDLIKDPSVAFASWFYQRNHVFRAKILGTNETLTDTKVCVELRGTRLSVIRLSGPLNLL